eukprot:gene4099-7386_t
MSNFQTNKATKDLFSSFFGNESQKYEKKILDIRESLQTQILTKILLFEKTNKAQELINSNSPKEKIEQLLKQKIKTLPGNYSKENDGQLKNYSLLIFLLRTEPKYFQNLFVLNDDILDTESFFLQLFGFAITSQEEYFFLELMESCFGYHIEDGKIDSFLSSDNMILRLLMNFCKVQNSFIEDFSETVLHSILEEYSFVDELKYLNSINSNEKSLEIDVLKVSKTEMSNSEISEGTKCKFESTIEYAKNNEIVASFLRTRTLKIQEICSKILDELLLNVEKMPTGIRFISKMIDQKLKLKKSLIDKSLRYSTIGKLFFRYLSQAFDLGKKICNSDFSIIPSILEHLMTKTHFKHENEELESSFNSYITKNFDGIFSSFIEKLIDFELNKPVDLPENSTIKLTCNQLFSLHSLISSSRRQLSKNKEDPIIKLLMHEEMKEIPQKLKVDETVHISILHSFEGKKGDTILNHQIYNQSKKNLKIILHYAPLNELELSVKNLIKKTKSYCMKKMNENSSDQEAKSILFTIAHFENDIPNLIKQNKISEENDYNEILDDIFDISSRQKLEFEKLNDLLKRYKRINKDLILKVTELDKLLNEEEKGMLVSKRLKFNFNQLKKKSAIIQHSIDESKLKNTIFSIGMMEKRGRYYLEISISMDQEVKKTTQLDVISLLKMKEQFAENLVFFDGLLTCDVNIFIHIVQKLIK